MFRALLEFVLILVIARSFWRVVGGLIEGLGGTIQSNAAGPRASGRTSAAQGVPMVRDPVCGTFVLPERAISINDGRHRVFFCSAACRDAYRARTA